jgi:hypothetical protein
VGDFLIFYLLLLLVFPANFYALQIKNKPWLFLMSKV